jgi:tripartite-type tricarboxylate transporter receptor subunit TctC
MNMKIGRLLLALAALAFGTSEAWAQGYPVPGKPIRIIVPTAPGGGNDVMSRIIAQKLTERMKTSVIVENKSGADGAIGSEYVAKAAPDGYTILFGYIATHGINPALSKLPYDAVKDFSPITLVAEAQGVLVVNPKLPVNSVKELIAYAKARPGVLNYASAGNGTAPHMSGELFKLLTGTQMVHVPYKGSAPGVTDTLAGVTQLMFPSLVAASQHIRSGKLRGLAVTSAKRLAVLPEVPTVEESGYPGFQHYTWVAVFVPSGTPVSIVSRINTDIEKSLAQPELRERLAALAFDPVGGLQESVARYVKAEIAKWATIVKETGAKAE